MDRASESVDGVTRRLRRCLRDMAALSALPALCIGRSPEETLEIVVDALPTALSCDLLLLSVPKLSPDARARLDGKELTGEGLAQLESAVGSVLEGSELVYLPGGRKLWCSEVELPFGDKRGRLLVGRNSPFDRETDRVLIRSAANLVGTALQAAQVLDLAHRKDEFLAMLGHELRNPLAPIMTAVELLARHPVAQREQKVLERQVRHLARLVDDLLDISRVTRGHLELESEPVPLSTVLERAVELAGPLISRYQHVLTVERCREVTVRGDLLRLTQVFSNLLTNAAKFTAPKGRIDVMISEAPGQVRVTVRDNGRGIAREHLGRIFEPFVQAQRAQDAGRGGLGLGLTIVKNLVERHGGSVSVDSQGMGRGTSFSVELPALAPVSGPLVPSAPRAQGDRSGLRVLVVDDNVDVAELLSEALGLEGFETAIAHDAHAALDVWRRFAPHAGVLDLGMPDLDGYELARRLRDEHGKDPVLIAASGYGQPQDRARSADAGFDCHLIKPISVQDVVHFLDRRLVVQ